MASYINGHIGCIVVHWNQQNGHCTAASTSKSVYFPVQASQASATDLRLWSSYVQLLALLGSRQEAIKVAEKALSMVQVRVPFRFIHEEPLRVFVFNAWATSSSKLRGFFCMTRRCRQTCTPKRNHILPTAVLCFLGCCSFRPSPKIRNPSLPSSFGSPSGFMRDFPSAPMTPTPEWTAPLARTMPWAIYS